MLFENILQLIKIRELCIITHKHTIWACTLGLFYDKVYADMMVLLKSTTLQKRFLCMNVHYLELLNKIVNWKA